MMHSMRDEVEPGVQWEFDSEVTEVFEDMLERSIPQYSEMRDLVTELATAIAPHTQTGRSSVIVDLGSSRGGALAPIIDRLGAHAQYHAAEVSGPMLETLRERWPQERIDEHGVHVHDHDLRLGFPPTPGAHVVLCVLTLQFTPIEHRQRILRNIYRKVVPGGALILVEKVLGATAEIDEQLVARYHGLKGANGYSPEQVERKRLSLEGVLVPVTAAWNEELLRASGFRHVDCFWRWSNFAGWLAMKDEGAA
jgi:tRNA (cmo5U34)-methyltransferase